MPRNSYVADIRTLKPVIIAPVPYYDAHMHSEGDICTLMRVQLEVMLIKFVSLCRKLKYQELL